jgi:hypothetical protein
MHVMYWLKGLGALLTCTGVGFLAHLKGETGDDVFSGIRKGVTVLEIAELGDLSASCVGSAGPEVGVVAPRPHPCEAGPEDFPIGYRIF